MRLIRDPQNGLRMAPANVQAAPARNDTLANRPLRGITSTDGATAFTRILSSNGPHGVFVLPDGPPANILASHTGVKPAAKRAASRDDLESTLALWWQELLGHDRVGLDDDFFDLGGQSLIVVRLFSKIKKTYGVNFGLSTLFEARTVRTLAQLIREASTKPNSEQSAGRALVAIQPGGTNLPLYVISGLGGNVIKFHSMAFYLGEDQPIFGLLPRGLDGGDSYHTRVEDMAADYVKAIREVQPEGPYRLVGYSFGGAVAFEVAQQIVAQGGVVGLLGMFDTIEWQYLERVERSLGFRERFAVYRSKLRLAASEEDPVAAMWKRLKSKSSRTIFRLLGAGGRSTAPSTATIEDVNIYAAANYRAKVYPGKLTLFRAITRGPLDGDDQFLGWGDLVDGGIEVHHIPATHLNILQEPGVRVLSEKLRECLDRDAAFASADLQVAIV